MIDVAVAVHVDENGLVAATTRPDGKLGLPGGKAEPGESLVDTLIRECEEEGWKIGRIDPAWIRQENIDDEYLCYWFVVGAAEPLAKYKDQHRGIIPIRITLEELISRSQGFKNEFLLEMASK